MKRYQAMRLRREIRLILRGVGQEFFRWGLGFWQEATRIPHAFPRHNGYRTLWPSDQRVREDRLAIRKSRQGSNQRLAGAQYPLRSPTPLSK